MPQSDDILATIDTDKLHAKAERYKSRASKKPRGTKKGNSLAPLWTILILVVAGSVAGILSIQNSRRRDRLAAHLLNQNRNRATEARKSIEATAKRTQAIARAVPDYENGARAAILRVVGRPLVAGEPAFPATPTSAQAEPTTSARRGPATAATTEEDPDAPPGLLTREELERRRNRQLTRTPDVQQPTQEVAPTREDPAIWTLGQALLEGTEQIRANASLVEELAVMARRDEREIMHDTRVDMAVRKIAEAERKAAEATEILKKTQRSFENVKVGMASITRLRKVFEEEERRRLAHEEKLRQEMELQERKEAEIERVVLLGREADDLIANLDPDKAKTLLVQAKAELATEEAREVMALYIEQCQQVSEMKAILIERFNAKPVRWGWRHAGGQRDITGANDALLKVAGGTVPWVKIPDSQFSYMALQFVHGRWKMAASKRSTVGLGTAILLAKRGNAAEATIIVEKLVYKVPSLAKKVERLVELY